MPKRLSNLHISLSETHARLPWLVTSARVTRRFSRIQRSCIFKHPYFLTTRRFLLANPELFWAALAYLLKVIVFTQNNVFETYAKGFHFIVPVSIGDWVHNSDGILAETHLGKYLPAYTSDWDRSYTHGRIHTHYKFTCAFCVNVFWHPPMLYIELSYFMLGVAAPQIPGCRPQTPRDPEGLPPSRSPRLSP